MATVTFTPVQDAYISEFFSTQNFGGVNALFVGLYQGVNDIYRSLLKFDISSIPANSTIISAKLRLYIFRNDFPLLSKPIQIYRLLSSFDEFTVTFANQPPIPVASDATLTITNELNTYLEWDMTNLASGWYNGSIVNNGIMIEGLESTSSIVGFRSKEYIDSSTWPQLEIVYTKGVLTEYPVENVATSDSFAGSTAIPLGTGAATFGIVNTGTINSALVKVQLSPDGVNWIDDLPLAVTLPSLVPGATQIINTQGNMDYARVAFKNAAPLLSTTLSIYAAVKD